MRRWSRTAALALAVTAAAAPAAGAQAPARLLQDGIRAYGSLEFDAAAALLRRALTGRGTPLTTDDQANALAYLGATEIFRDRADSATAVFRRLVRAHARYRIDRLIFPPEVSLVFDAVRRRNPVAVLRLAPRDTVQVAGRFMAIDLFGSTFHRVRVEVATPDGQPLRTIYAGPVSDSLRIEWDGRGRQDDEPVAPGRYALSVTSVDSLDAVGRIVRIPLALELIGIDTLDHPAPPADSLLLPERSSSGPALEALISSLAVGTAIAVLPSALSPDADLSETRFAVGAAVSIAGIAGFLQRRPGRPIPENIVVNDRVRADWQGRVDAVAGQNRARMRRARLEVRPGAPQIIEPEGE